MKTYLIQTCCTLLLAGLLFAAPVAAAPKSVALNFNEVDIATMVKFISDLTGKNFLLDERVKGKISLYSPSRLSLDEAYNVFTSVLELKGFTLVPSGKVLKIVPTASAKTSGIALLPSGKRPPVNDSYLAQLVRLEHISAQEAIPFLQPLVSKDGGVSAFGSGSILILDEANNLRKVQDILAIIDTERARDGMEVVFLKNASAETAAKAIGQWLSGAEPKGAPSGAAGASGGTASVMADQRLNALFVFGNQAVKKAVLEMVSKLDVPSPETSSKINVYYLENTDATDMAKVLESVLKGIGAGSGAAVAVGQASFAESGKITVTADKTSNSLVITAAPSDYNNLMPVIKKLDRRSKQVFVQVFIAEVSLSKSQELGVELGALGAGEIGRYLGVGGIFDPFGAVTALESAAGSTLTKPGNIGAILKALEGKSLVNVLSTPNILTSDNKDAEIVVGQNVPFQGTSTVSSGVTTTSIERKDVGITLKIKPQIGEGDYIRMELSQEISAVGSTVTVGSGTTDRITTKRSAKTSIVVKDNQIIAIAGLIQAQDDESESKIPFFGDIPGLGWLFQTKTRSKTKTNLMILMVPHIVKDGADMAALSDRQREKFDSASAGTRALDLGGEAGGK